MMPQECENIARLDMAILDLLDEVSGRQFQKTEMGEERVTGVVVGIVTENYHKDFPGKVRVRIPVRDDNANVLKWAKVARVYSGKEWTHYFLPEKDDQVLVAFEHGNIEKPYVIASLPRDGDRVISETADADNQLKKIVTRHGNSLIFFDHKDGDGKKDHIELHTAEDSLQMMLDNEKQSIRICDKEKHCEFEMKTEKGTIQILADKKITICAGDKIKVYLNGENGTVQVKADKIVMQSGRGMELKTDGTAKFSGQQTVLEASASLKQSSNGMVTISGNPIKLG